jgi:hypothetical protein
MCCMECTGQRAYARFVCPTLVAPFYGVCHFPSCERCLQRLQDGGEVLWHMICLVEGVSQGRQGVCICYTAAASKFSDHGQRSRLRPAEADRSTTAFGECASSSAKIGALGDCSAARIRYPVHTHLDLTATHSPVLGSPLTR